MADPLDITLPASDPLTTGAAATAAATSAQAASATGVAVTFLGQTLQVITAAETATRVPGFVASGPGGNAEDTDPRSFGFARADLAALGLRDPRDGDTVTWPGAGDYTVTRAFYVPSSGRVSCLCYRPSAPAGAQDAAQLAVWTGYAP